MKNNCMPNPPKSHKFSNFVEEVHSNKEKQNEQMSKYYFKGDGFQKILICKPLHRLLTMIIDNNTGHVTSWMSAGLVAEKMTSLIIVLYLK